MAAEDPLGIKGRTAIVSGSTRGVGRAVAVALAGAGAKVAVNYVRDEENAKKVLSEIRALGAEAVAIRADVTDERESERLVREAGSSLGAAEILVNCAHGNIQRAMFPDTDWGMHQAQMDGILKGAYNLSRAVHEGMKSKGRGRIVNIGNNMLAQPVTGYSAYTSAMAALLGFTRNLAAELGPAGITVNMVSTGFVPFGIFLVAIMKS